MSADERREMRMRLVHDERGIALVLAIFTMLVLTIITSTLITVVVVNGRSSTGVMNTRRAFGIAESCLAYAEGSVYGAAAAHGSPSLTPLGCDTNGGTGLYWASVAGDGVTWTMHGEGTYNGITRFVTAQANVPGPVTVQDTGVWNYLYADSTSGACPTTISGNTTVSVPTFVRGNLCLSAAFTGSQLGVGGSLTVSGSGAIGSSGSKISSLAVAGTCDGVTAGTGVCNGSTGPVYATTVSSSLGITPGLPALDLTGTYTNANPGPATGHGCPVGSGQPTNFFDNNTTLDHSDGTINLFPNSNYDCINGSNELKWCHTVSTTPSCPVANRFTANGTFFFDGNLSFSGNTNIVYNGLASIYVSGSIAVAGGFSLCGISGCTSAWTTANAALVFVAACWNNSTGSSLVSLATTSSYCVDYGGNSVMQVGTYCKTDYHIAGTSTSWGPVLSNTLALNGNLSQLVPFTVMPPGTPTNTSTSYLPASAPTYWSG